MSLIFLICFLGFFFFFLLFCCCRFGSTPIFIFQNFTTNCLKKKKKTKQRRRRNMFDEEKSKVFPHTDGKQTENVFERKQTDRQEKQIEMGRGSAERSVNKRWSSSGFHLLFKRAAAGLTGGLSFIWTNGELNIRCVAEETSRRWKTKNKACTWSCPSARVWQLSVVGLIF